jgi:hypothetical protein
VQDVRRGWRAWLPLLAVVLVGFVFAIDARPAPTPVSADRLEADVRLELATACTPVSPGAPTLLVSPGEVVVDEAREVVVDLPVLFDDLPEGALVGVGIALAGVDDGAVGVPFEPERMNLRLGAPEVVGPGRWPIVVAYRPQGEGRVTLLGSMTMRAAAGYRPPQFTLEVSRECPPN